MVFNSREKFVYAFGLKVVDGPVVVAFSKKLTVAVIEQA